MIGTFAIGQMALTRCFSLHNIGALSGFYQRKGWNLRRKYFRLEAFYAQKGGFRALARYFADQSWHQIAG